MPDARHRKIFVNIPVADLDRSVEFFTRLGFAFDPQFTDRNAACMIVSDQAFVMLLVEDFFRAFTTRELCDARRATEAILALSAESRDQVDELAEAALAAGAQPAGEPDDRGFMYMRNFHDPDGHLWEIVWLDPAAMRRAMQGAGSTA
jgi:uncharacterized protein